MSNLQEFKELNKSKLFNLIFTHKNTGSQKYRLVRVNNSIYTLQLLDDFYNPIIEKNKNGRVLLNVNREPRKKIIIAHKDNLEIELPF